MTWEQVCQFEPGLKEYQTDAREIAKNERWPWYARWIGGYHKLRQTLHDVADRHGLDYGEIRAVTVAALLDSYQTTRDRERRRREKRPA
jgi:hypothetical protein